MNVVSPQTASGAQYTFAQWQDGSTSTTDTVTAPATSAVYAASFTTTTAIAVTGVNPASEDYGLDSPVTITALLSWGGNGPAPTASDVSIGGNGPSSYGATTCGAPSGTTMTCTNTYTPTAMDTPGSYTETAIFAGDSNYAGSTSSQTNNFTINQASATTVITSNLSPSAFGQAVTFTATINGENGQVTRRTTKGAVKPQTVTGTVTWGSNTGCGTTPVTPGNPGTATCVTSSLPVGSDTVMGTYNGDGNHGSSPGSVIQTVNQAAPSISVTSVSPSNEDYGLDSPITITAVLTWTGSGTPPTASDVTISGNGPSGTYGTTSCGAPSGNSLTCSNTYTPSGADAAGSYTETAAFSGDSNYSASNSTQSNNFTINLASSTTAVSSGTNPSTYGQSVTFTATITGENGQVTASTRRGRQVKAQVVGGSVVWSGNTGCGTTNVTSGVATCTTSILGGGNDTITAAYQGDSNHSMSTGTLADGQVVNRATQSITVSTPAPTTEVYNGSFTIGASASSGLTLSFTSSGVCTNVAAGTYTMTAGTGTCTEKISQAGDVNYLPASTLTETTTATEATQMVSFTGAPATAPYGSSFVVTATSNSGITAIITTGTGCTVSGNTITMKTASATCTMTATWSGNGNYKLATATQTTTGEKATPTITWATPAAITYGTKLTTTQLDAVASAPGKLAYTPAKNAVLEVGSYTLSVAFTPTSTADYNTANATVPLQVLQQSTATTIKSSSPTVTMNRGGLATSTLDFNVAAYKPTGTVSLVASTGEVCSGSVNINGNGSCKLTFTTAGARTIVATYSGDLNHTGSNSSANPPVTVTVNP